MRWKPSWIATNKPRQINSQQIVARSTDRSQRLIVLLCILLSFSVSLIDLSLNSCELITQ